jgi:hypothetical protein
LQPLPLLETHHPTTFIERGVSVPFTTPLLLGARVRPSHRHNIEVIVPNPSGGRGVYIAPWSGISAMCRPTVHDTRLFQLIAERHGITPASIRAAAQIVAAQGLAGREAAAAAALAQATDQRDRVTTLIALLVAMVQQIDPSRAVAPPPLNTPRDIESYAAHAATLLAPRLDRSTAAIFTDLEHLAQVFAAVGLEGQDPPARVCRLLAEIRRFRTDAAGWASETADRSGVQARLAVAVADVAIGSTEAILADEWAGAKDIIGLLAAWAAAPHEVARRLTHVEWLVDGWEQICLIWRIASSKAARRVALAEIALLMPILPKEAAVWLKGRVDIELVDKRTLSIRAGADWRTGMQFDRTARNEALRALAA